jgi:hypothetical protein
MPRFNVILVNTRKKTNREMSEAKGNQRTERGSIVYIETDIDSTFCLDEVKDELSCVEEVPGFSRRTWATAESLPTSTQ